MSEIIKSAMEFEPQIDMFDPDIIPTEQKNRKHIKFFDTTLRDGEQAVDASMTAEEKLYLAELIARTNVDRMELGFPSSTIEDLKACQDIVKMINRKGFSTEVCALGRCGFERKGEFVTRDIDAITEALKDAKKPFYHIFIGTSPIHRREKLNMKEEQVLDSIHRSIAHARAESHKVSGKPWPVEFSAEDAMRTELPFLIKAVRVAILSGADRINLPDTVGINNDLYTGYVFHQVIKACQDLIDHARANGGDIEFSIHAHNDRATAVASSIRAMINGATQIEGCLGNWGERAGNTNLIHVAEQISANGGRISPHTNFTHQLDSRKLTPTQQAICDVLGASIDPKTPVYGEHVTLHGAGIHQDGMNKTQEKLGSESAYNIVDISEYGGREGERVTCARSGSAHIQNAMAKFDIHLDKKRDAKLLAKLSQRVKQSSTRTRGVYPAQVLIEYSRELEGYIDPQFKISGDQVEIKFYYSSQINALTGKISPGNSGVEGVINAIKEYARQPVDIIDLNQRNQMTLTDVDKRYQASIRGQAISPNSGSQAEAISQITISNGQNTYTARAIDQDAEQAHMKAAFEASWPIIRESLIGEDEPVHSFVDPRKGLAYHS